MKTQKFKAFSLFCIMNLAICIPSNAQIIYTDVFPDDTINTIGGNYLLDLNNDGINDFKIKYSSFQSGLCGGSTLPAGLLISITPYGSNEVGISQPLYGLSSSPNALQQNTSIDSSSLIWKTDSNQGLAAKSWHCVVQSGWPHAVSSYNGSWLGVSSNYLSLRLHVGVQTYYGWVQLDVNSTVTSFTVKDYAYNSISNHQIFAGDTCVFPVSLNVTGNDSICLGDAVMLSVSGGSTFLWSIGNTSQSISVSPLSPTLYSVTVNDSSTACTAILNQIINVSNLNATVHQTFDTLYCIHYVGGGDTFQWIDCATQQIIPGATDYFYIPPASGTFAIIYSIYGCSDTSACYTYATVGINEKEGLLYFDISPNPFSHYTTISFSLEKSEIFSLKIFDVNGRIINTIVDHFIQVGKHQIELNSEKLDAGIYFLQIQTEKYFKTEKLIVSK